MATAKVYIIWLNVIRRCTNPNYIGYHNYGGRGIKVCRRWKNSFENFLEDMGELPSDKHQINRINNNRGYCKSNCHWVTPKQQQRNRRNNHPITHGGKTQCLVEWAEELSIESSLLRYRLKHWSIEKALMTLVIKRRKKK